MGKQDHYAAAYGGINYIRFYDDETVTVRPINMTTKNIQIFFDSIAITLWAAAGGNFRGFSSFPCDFPLLFVLNIFKTLRMLVKNS